MGPWNNRLSGSKHLEGEEVETGKTRTGKEADIQYLQDRNKRRGL